MNIVHVTADGKRPESALIENAIADIRGLTYVHAPVDYPWKKSPGWDAMPKASKRAAYVGLERRRVTVTAIGYAIAEAKEKSRGQGGLGGQDVDVLIWDGHGHVIHRDLDSPKWFIPSNEKSYDTVIEWMGEKAPGKKTVGLPPEPAEGYRCVSLMGTDTTRDELDGSGVLVHGVDVLQTTDLPDAVLPKKLWYSGSCFGAWNPTFAAPVLARGVPGFIGARVPWQGGDVMTLFAELMKSWSTRSFSDDTLESAYREAVEKARRAYPVFYRATGRRGFDMKAFYAPDSHTNHLNQIVLKGAADWASGRDAASEVSLKVVTI